MTTGDLRPPLQRQGRAQQGPAQGLELLSGVSGQGGLGATALGYPTRKEFLDDYRRRTDAVRAAYREVLG